MTQTFVACESGAHRCYATTTGRDRRFLGCAHRRPKEAVAHTSGSYVSPLRPHGPGSTPVPDSREVGVRSEAPAADPSHATAGASLGL